MKVNGKKINNIVPAVHSDIIPLYIFFFLSQILHRVACYGVIIITIIGGSVMENSFVFEKSK